MTNDLKSITVTDELRELLKGFDLNLLVRSPNVCYVIDADLRLVYVNDAYLRFGVENGTPDIAETFGPGCSILDAISGPQKSYYEHFLRTALSADSPQALDYECSSPDQYREFHMVLYPLHNQAGLLADHALNRSGTHSRVAIPFDPSWYRDANGIIHQCGHCRRVRHTQTNAYDWCPEALNVGPVSHGLCASCLDFYYPDE